MKKIILIVIAVIIVAAVSALWLSGAFQSIEVKAQEVGPIRVVYLEHKGPYHKTAEKIFEVEKMLKEKNIPYTAGYGEYMDNPQMVKPEDLRSNGGIVLSPTVSGNIAINPPFKSKVIEKRTYASAAFSGSPAVGPFKVYPKLNQWMKEKGYSPSGPAIELYRIEKGKMAITFLMPFSTSTLPGQK